MIEVGELVAINIVMWLLLRSLDARARRDAARVELQRAASNWQSAGWIPLSYECNGGLHHRLRCRWHSGTQEEVLEVDARG